MKRSNNYLSHGVPLETYELTQRDHRNQKTAEDIRDAVRQQLAEVEAEESADPVLRDRRQAKRREALNMLCSICSSPTPNWQIVGWRVRLYCGDIVETHRHREVDEPTRHGSSSMRCPDCGMDPARIVAYYPIALCGLPAEHLQVGDVSR